MKHFIVFVILAAACFSAAAESVHLVTDKNVYVAGDLIWCSAFCTENGALSNSSAVAYVELASSDGIFVKAKIALVSGRGAGVISLPSSIPTGNYRLFAYTAASDKADAGIVSIFNTQSGTRARNAVEVCNDPLSKPEGGMEVSGPVEVSKESAEGRTLLHLYNPGTVDVTAAVSVYEDDGLQADPSAPVQLTLTPREPENDGEIIRARTFGRDAGKLLSSPWLTAVISSPGSAADTYTGKIDSDGTISFKTNNIYGDRDLICEILGLEAEGNTDCRFSPVDPFVVPEGLDVPALRLSPSMRKALTARHLALKSSVKADTLYEFLPKRDNLLLSNEDCISYHLDDYTRFDSVEDIIIELIPRVAVQKVRGHRQLKMVTDESGVKSRTYNVLAMLDGVPVSDHERILCFDALALSDVLVYPYMYAFGNTVFSGVVNFVTTRRDMSALQFDSNVRIVDFCGCSYPVALRTPEIIGGSPAGRTLFWQPLVRISAGEHFDIEVPDTEVAVRCRVFGYSKE